MFRSYKTIIVNICRLVVGLTFIVSGFVKAIDPLGTQYKIEDYLIALGIPKLLSQVMTLGTSVLLSTLELSIGVFVLLAIGRKIFSRVALVFMTVMTIVTVWIFLADPVQDCGCFGDAIVLTNGQTLLKNIILLLCTVVLARWPRCQFRLLSNSNQWIVFHYAVIFSLLLSIWCLYDLPTFDFRPYYVGSDLRAAMEKPDDAPIHDFFIESTDSTREDITDSIIYDKGYTFLLIAPWLDKADDSNFGYIDEVYEYAQDNKCGFICLTASGAKDIAAWSDITGAEYPFYNTDGTLLKTIIRSNPGLVLLKDGKIIGKWSHNNLPHGEKLFQPIAKADWAHQQVDNVWYRLLKMLMLFFVPLLVLIIADRLWAWSRWVKSKEDTNIQKVKSLTLNKKEK